MSRIDPSVEIVNMVTMQFVEYGDLQKAIATVIVERIMLYLLQPSMHEFRHYRHGTTIPPSTGDIIALFSENFE